MPYQPSSPQLDIRRSVQVDVYDAAHGIQHLLDPVLAPPEVGVYLPDQLEPVLRQGAPYWFEKPVELESDIKTSINMTPSVIGVVGGTLMYAGDSIMVKQRQPWKYYRYEYIPMMNLEEALLSPWDIVDRNPILDQRPKNVVLPHHLAVQASMTSDLPVTGLKLTQQIIQTEIDTSRAYNPRRSVLLEELVLPFLQPQYQALEHIRSDRWFQENLSVVFDMMAPILAPIRDALRHNPYQMCVVKHHDRYLLRVDQLGDFRIMEWERITSDPDYQRWLQLKNNGEWERYVHQRTWVCS